MDEKQRKMQATIDQIRKLDGQCKTVHLHVLSFRECGDLEQERNGWQTLQSLHRQMAELAVMLADSVDIQVISGYDDPA